MIYAKQKIAISLSVVEQIGGNENVYKPDISNG